MDASPVQLMAASLPGPHQCEISVLGVVVRDLVGLESTFGSAVLGGALQELSQTLDNIAAHVLARHRTSRPLDQPGMWATVFECHAETLPRDADEVRQTIVDAVASHVEGTLLRIFGVGTGSRIEFAVAILPLPPAFELHQVARVSGEHSKRLADVLQQQLREVPPSTFRPVGISDPFRRRELQSILESRCVRTLLQPIVSLRDGRVLGYEALSRGPEGSALEYPDQLFGAARRVGEELRLELLCADLALHRTKGRLAPGRFLTLNLGPEALLRAVDQLDFEGRADVMVELTEHMPLDEIDRLAPAVQRLRSMGVGIVLDDTGCGFADFDTAAALQPDIVKLCITVTRQVERAGPVHDAISDTVQRLRLLGCRVLAEGVETAAQRDALLEWPIELAQGWLFARAASIEQVLGESARPGQ